jgi:hypothetical protein
MFTVEWLQEALNELATAWMQANTHERQEITAASQMIDDRLSRNPHQEGESRPGGRRIMFVPPLAVTFQVEADGQTVTVLSVRFYRRRGR